MLNLAQYSLWPYIHRLWRQQVNAMCTDIGNNLKPEALHVVNSD